MRDTVSIIVPVYNVDLYLEECLISITEQSYRNLEIIIVDDGSTDRSFQIMQDFAKEDNRIHIFSQTNRGASSARNNGLSKASGEYILFVDSDDIIEKYAVEILYKKTIKTQSDITIGSLYYYYPNGERKAIFERDNGLNDVTLRGVDCFISLMRNNVFPPFVYLYFINRKFLINQQLYFEEGIIHEDELWCLKVLCHASRVSLFRSSHYLYRQREGSIMNSKNLEFRIKSYYTVAYEIDVFIKTFTVESISIYKELIGCVYTKIFRLFWDMTSLEHSHIKDEYIYFFTDLLIDIYPDIKENHQKKCLDWFRLAIKRLPQSNNLKL